MIKKKIFIFGVNGFIGTALEKFLMKKKISSIDYDKNLRLHNHDKNYYFKFWDDIIKKTNIIVYAYFNNDINELSKNPSTSIQSTLIPLYILLEVIKLNKKKIKIIYLSSASVYGNQKILPVDEKRNIQINNLYDCLKILSEQIIIKSNLKNMEYSILRLSNVYGENYSKLKQKNRQILSKIIKNAFKLKKIIVYGHGKYFRDYIHVSDVCVAIYKVIKSKNSKNEIFNIGSGYKVQLITIFKLIQKIIFKKYGHFIRLNTVKVNKDDISFIRNYRSSNRKAKKLLNWKSNISLISGITNLIDFIYKEEIKKL